MKRKGWGKQSEIKKKERKKSTKQNKNKNKKNKKNHGGVSSDSVYFKSLDFPWNWSV